MNAKPFVELGILVDDFVVDERTPGLAYGVFRDGEQIHDRGIGVARLDGREPPTVDTVFRIASMTKSFTAATVLLLRDDGLVVLDEPIGTYVPELADMKAPHRGAPAITVRHLLTMSSGLPTDDPWGDRQQDLDIEQFSAFLQGGQTFAWMPGTEFEYSNLGYGILGRLITNVAGSEYRDVVRARLLEPLGLTDTVYTAEEVPPERLATGYQLRDEAFMDEPFAGYGALASMGGLFSSVRDLGVWVNGFASAFLERPARHPLSRASRLEMQQGTRLIRPEITWTDVAELPVATAEAYGYGLFVTRDPRIGTVISHVGGYPGFGSSMRWHPASGLGLVVLANRTYFPAGKLAERMLRHLVLAGAASSRPLARSPALEAARDTVEGLIRSWEDEVAERMFAMNIPLDEPLDRRKYEIAGLRETHGALRRSDEDEISRSPMHLEWWLDGERGRVRLEISVDPEPEPRVQKLLVTSVPEPEPWVVAAAEDVTAVANAQATNVAPTTNADPVPLDRDALIVRTLFGRLALGPIIASKNDHRTFRVRGENGDVDLELTIGDGAVLIGVKWIPRALEAPAFDAR
jgi:CubicO group peptidase (beta-lactamase class C family)